MARVNTLITNFTGGEISPRLFGRPDLSFFPNSCRRMENAVSLPTGPASRRPGTRFVKEVKYSSKQTYVLRFEFSVIQAYIIEAGDKYFRFYKDRGRIESGGSPVEIVTPYLDTELAELVFTQSADVLYIDHANHQPMKLERTSHTDWTLTEIEFTDGPYLPENALATATLTPSAITGNITITASGISEINRGAGYLATDIGRLVRIKHTATWGYAKITAVTSTTVVSATVKADFGDITASAAWRLGIWSDTDGWPSAISLHEERLAHGGAGALPHRYDMSRTGDFENMTPGANDDDAISRTLGANPNKINWLSSLKAFLLGSAAAEYIIDADSLTTPLTPANTNTIRQAGTGSSPVQPLTPGNVLLFVQRHGRKLMEMALSFEDDGFVPTNLSIRADHLTTKTKKIVNMAWQQEPFSTVWATRSDGMLLGFTYVREQKVTAWHRHPLGGAGKCKSVAVIPGVAEDECWMVAKRMIGGQVKRTIEFIEDWPDDDTPIEDMFFCDSGLSLDNTQLVTLTPAAVSGTGVTFTAGGPVFEAGDVGRYMRYRYAATDGEGDHIWLTAIAEIMTYVSETVVTADIHSDFPSATAIASGAWRLTVTTITGANHLEGETVQVLGDGAVQTDKLVVSGGFTLDSPAATVHIGLQYSTKIAPVTIEAGTRIGTAQTLIQRIHEVGVRLHRSLVS